MVRRSYSPMAYLFPIAIGAVLIPLTIMNILDLYHALEACNDQFCRNLGQLSLNEEAGELVLAGLATWRWADQLQTARRNNRLRQRAARGDDRPIPIAWALKTPNQIPLDLPARFRLRMAWRSRQTLFVFAALFVIVQIVIACTALTLNPAAEQPVLLYAFLESLIVGFLAFLFLFLFVGLRERLDVTEEGLRVCRLGRSHSVRWSDARLFALVKSDEFELSSASSIVRWTRIEKAQLVEPDIPFADYQRRMDALLLLIHERTGLALHDISASKD